MQFDKYTRADCGPVRSKSSSPKIIHPYGRYQARKSQGDASYRLADSESFVQGCYDGTAARPSSSRNSPQAPVAGPSNPRQSFCLPGSTPFTEAYDVNEGLNHASEYNNIADNGFSQSQQPHVQSTWTPYTHTPSPFNEVAESSHTPQLSLIPSYYDASGDIVDQYQAHPGSFQYRQQESGHFNVTSDNSFDSLNVAENWTGEDNMPQSQGYVNSNENPPRYDTPIRYEPSMSQSSDSEYYETPTPEWHPTTNNDYIGYPPKEVEDYGTFFTGLHSGDFVPPPLYEFQLPDEGFSESQMAVAPTVPSHQTFEHEKAVAQEEPLFITIPTPSSRYTSAAKKRSGEKKKATIAKTRPKTRLAAKDQKNPSTQDSLARAFVWKWQKNNSKVRKMRVLVRLETENLIGEAVPRVEVKEEDLPLLSCPVEGCTTQCRGAKKLQAHFKAGTRLETDPGHGLVIINVKGQQTISCLASNCETKVARGNMYRHLFECHANVSFYCTMCDQNHTRAGNMMIHFKRVHLDEEAPTHFREIVHRYLNNEQPWQIPSS